MMIIEAYFRLAHPLLNSLFRVIGMTEIIEACCLIRLSELVVGDEQGYGEETTSPPCGMGPCEQAQGPWCGLQADQPGRREAGGVRSISPPISPWRKEQAGLSSDVVRAKSSAVWR